MKAALRRGALVLQLGVLVSCTTGGTASTPPVHIADIAGTAKLQLAVGTATIGYRGGYALGTNFVATFRGPDGNNATGSNSPTLSGPAHFNFGPNLGNSNSITGVLPSTFKQAYSAVQSGGAYPTALQEGFGPLTGVFGYGFASDNTVSNFLTQALEGASGGASFCFGIATTANTVNVQVSSGLPTANGAGGSTLNPPSNVVRSAELGLPIPSGLGNGASSSTCPNAPPVLAGPFYDNQFPINYYGGPPAWPSPQGYGAPSYFVGYPLGFTDFVATPVAGQYALSVAFATDADYTTYGHLSATATLRRTAGLGPMPPALLTINPDGSGVVAVNVPPGVSEAIVTVRTVDCNLSANAPPDNYAVVTHSAGLQRIVFSSNLGPPDATGRPQHTFCTNSDLQASNALAKAAGLTPQATQGYGSSVLAVGFDYPAYEASYPFNVSPSPQIANTFGQTDVTTAYPTGTTTILTDPTVSGG